MLLLLLILSYLQSIKDLITSTTARATKHLRTQSTSDTILYQKLVTELRDE